MPQERTSWFFWEIVSSVSEGDDFFFQVTGQTPDKCLLPIGYHGKYYSVKTICVVPSAGGTTII
jgi:hypothetical protein